MGYQILQGDWIERLRELPDESVNCCVTSPPYWGLRDYGVPGQLGLERTPEEYVAKMVEGFREVRRVLRGDGTLWMNLGDSYAANRSYQVPDGKWCDVGNSKPSSVPDGLKPKDLCGIPWMVAFALRSDGWWLRQDIIWSKPNPMPESVTDRCTKAHEYLFLMTKSERYHCDMGAIKEPWTSDRDDMRKKGVRTGTAYLQQGQNAYSNSEKPDSWHGSSFDKGKTGEAKHTRGGKIKVPGGWDRGDGAHGTIHRDGRTSAEYQEVEVSPYRNKRTVWEIATSPFPEAHFATFPPKLVEPCILAGCPENGTVLDPFNGAGTTGLVATRLQRNYIGIELNPEYVTMAEKRIRQDAPLFNSAPTQNDEVTT